MRSLTDQQAVAEVMQAFPIPCCGPSSVAVQADEYGWFAFCAVCWMGLESPIGAGFTMHDCILDWNRRVMGWQP